MNTFFSNQGFTYRGDKQHPLDVEISDPPSALHTWNGVVWVAPDLVANAETEAIAYLVSLNKSNQFLFTMFYELDKRLRVLEAKVPITRLQFLNGVKQLYKDA